MLWKIRWGEKVYPLFREGTIGDYAGREEILQHEGIFGIQAAAWEWMQLDIIKMHIWTVLFRLHPQFADKINVFVTNIVDVSKYPDMQELLLISDALIRDYSSCAWDFVQTGRPVFLFATDLEHYVDDRGLYYPLHKLPYEVFGEMDYDGIRKMSALKWMLQ